MYVRNWKIDFLKLKFSVRCNKSEFRTFTRAWPNFLSNIQRSKKLCGASCSEASQHQEYKPTRRDIYQWKDTETHNWRGPAFWTLISVAEKSSHSITESILACVHSAPWHAMAYGGKMWRGHKRRVGRQLATTVSVIDVFSFNISIVGIVL